MLGWVECHRPIAASFGLENIVIAETTRLAIRLGEGDRNAASTLVPIVYDELRALAEAYMRRETTGHTLQPTALVHEVFLRLVESDKLEWKGRAQFIALAASQIRKVLVDHSRRRGASKRGAGLRRTALEVDPATSRESAVDLLDLNDALAALAQRSPRQSQVVELRFFGGLSVAEVASVLDISERTVKDDWRTARAWLKQAMER